MKITRKKGNYYQFTMITSSSNKLYVKKSLHLYTIFIYLEFRFDVWCCQVSKKSINRHRFIIQIGLSVHTDFEYLFFFCEWSGVWQ